MGVQEGRALFWTGCSEEAGHSVKGYLDFHLEVRKNGARLDLLGEK